jgi:hypothetical protein
LWFQKSDPVQVQFLLIRTNSSYQLKWVHTQHWLLDTRQVVQTRPSEQRKYEHLLHEK